MILGRTDSRGRLTFLLIVFVLAAGTLVARLGWWQVSQRERLAADAQKQIYLQTTVPAVRGAIYDRSGTIILADSVTRDRLIANPKRLTAEDRAHLVTLLAARLGLDPVASQALALRLMTDRTYLVIAKDLAPDDTDAILAQAAAMKITGLSVESAQIRQYPQPGGGPLTSMAAHLLGFVNREGAGQYGVEQYYQDLLAGTPTVIESDRDANGNAVRETERVVEAGTPGSDLSLTIDAGLQLALEQEVMQAWLSDKAKSVSAVVLDPYTGAVLAEATYPSYDANDYGAVGSEDPGRFIDPVVSKVYEPGSVFKMLTVVAGLESGTTTLASKFDDTGVLKLDNGKTRIADADHKAMGSMRLEDAIAFSRNVVAARVALGLAKTTQQAATVLHDVWARMGFGAKTGVDVAGEVAGLVRDPAQKTWRQIDLANGSFGQGVAVTPMQLAAAYAAMVNGGTLVTPHVVAAVDGKPVAVQDRGRVMDPELSPVMMDLMHHVLVTVPFYRDRTLIPGTYVGGKTGTAQIWDATINDWKPNKFNYSFVGYMGRRVGYPDLVVSVLINEAHPGVRRANQLAMPVMSFELFRRIATDAMSIPGLLPELAPLVAPTGRLGD